MPILASEPDLFPDDLLEQELSAAMQWYVMYTLSRREKELMRQLRAKGIAHYGPIAEQRRRSPSGRVRTSYVPLFAGYVFVYGTEEDRYNAIATGCISKCIEVTDGELLQQDLKRIWTLLTEGQDVRPELQPVVGRRARVISGPMTGSEGTITRAQSQHRLTIMVQFMQQGASVVIDEADIEFLD
jgi:transcriptional antiterminator RfaH